MTDQSNAPEWGPICRCDCPHLVHRGEGHAGACGSVRCARAIQRGWSSSSRCAGFVAKVYPDAEQPYAHVRATP